MIPYSLHSIGEEEIRAVNDVLRSGCLTGGPKVPEFEAKFAEYIGVKHAIAVNSCSSALYLALKATFPGRRVNIAIPALTYVSTANAVVLAGHYPIVCDVDRDTFCLDPGGIPDVEGIIPVHYAGHPCDLDAIKDRFPNIPIIEDAAHACGAEYKGKKIGSINTTCFSFHPCKNMTTAEGGMITTESRELADLLRRIRLNGIIKDGIHQDMTDWGFKFNMNEIQAAMGIEQLKKLEKMNARRREIAGEYKFRLRELEFQASNLAWSSCHLFPILVENRDEVALKLRDAGIGCAIHYKPVHLMSWYQERYGYKRGDFPIAEYIGQHELSIPIYPDMTDEKVDYVIEKVKEAVSV